MTSKLSASTNTLLACLAGAIISLHPERAKANLFTFQNSTYIYQYDASSSNLSPSNRGGSIIGSFEYAPTASFGSFSNVSIFVGGYSDPEDPSLDIIGNSWIGGAAFNSPGGQYGVNLGPATAPTAYYNRGSAANALTEYVPTASGTVIVKSQRLFFWYDEECISGISSVQQIECDENTVFGQDGRGISILLSTHLADIIPGDYYEQDELTPGLEANNPNLASNNYFCNAVLDGATTQLNPIVATNGVASGCATDKAGEAGNEATTFTQNQMNFYQYSFALTAPSPSIGLGLLPLLQVAHRRRRSRAHSMHS